MGPGPSRPIPWSALGVAAAAIAAAGVVWWATGPWGAGLSPDAIAYTAVAERLRDHGELGYWLEPKMSSWPPLFPTLLAAVAAGDHEVVGAARIVNALVHAATVVVAALLAWRMLRTAWLRVTVVVFAVLAQPLIFVVVRVWSEPLFDLLLLSAVLVLAGVPGRSPTARVLVASGLTVAAFTTRYAGLVFVLAGALALVAFPRSTPRRERSVRALLFGLPALAAAAALLLWNEWRTGQVFGPRWHPDEPFWEHAADGLAAVGRWALPADGADAVAIVGGALLFVVVAVTLVRAWRSEEADGSSRIGEAPVLAIFVACYFVYMVWARTTSGFDPLNSRLMLPMFLPGLLLALTLLERYALARPAGAARHVVLALPLLVLVPSVVDGLDELRRIHDVGHDYGNAAVEDFAASSVWQDVPDDCDVITNDPWLLWLVGVEAQLSPERTREVAIPQSMELHQLPALAESSDLCLVWLDTASTVFYTPDELAEQVSLEEVATDGFTTVYRVGPLE